MWLATRCIASTPGLVALINVVGVAVADDYQSHFLYLGNDPSQLHSEWSNAAQGIAHDDANWYISQRYHLWRFPANSNLNSFGSGMPGVTTRALSSYPALAAEGYDHFGDLCVHRYNGTDYLLVPIEGGPAGVAVIDADTLTYIDHAPMTAQSHASWCGVDATGSLYGSQFDMVDELLKYSVDWSRLQQTGELRLQLIDIVPLRDASGTGPIAVTNVQGGEFTPDGHLLYLVADGIHVFDASDTLNGLRRTQSSSNGAGPFNYQFNDGPPNFDEPEGLTIWDLEQTPSPHAGELHVMLLDNDKPLSDDDIYVKHYTRVIRVDAANAGLQDGTPARPFRTVADASALAWDGAEIRIRATTYNESVSISKRVRLASEGGTARIGD